MTNREIHVHIHINEGVGLADADQPQVLLQAPEPKIKTKGKSKSRETRPTDIKDAIGKTWYRRDIQRSYTDGFPAWMHLEGTRPSERADMGVEFEGAELEFINVVGKRARRGFDSGFARNLKAERMTRILKEEAKIIGGTDHLDEALQYTADFLNFMPRVSDERRAELKAIVLNQELPLAS